MHFGSCFLSLPVGGKKAIYNFRSSELAARKSSTNAHEISEGERTIVLLRIDMVPRLFIFGP